jgi:phage gpG-like protein
VVGNGIEIGSPLKYAAIQNYGGKTKAHKIKARNGGVLRFFPKGGAIANGKRKKKSSAAYVSTKKKSIMHPGSVIPARPFLVIQDSDVEYMKERLLSHIMGG